MSTVASRPASNQLDGLVRLTGHELADRRRSKLSRGELTPFSERGSAVLLEDVAAVEVTVWILLKKVEASCDRYLIAGGTNVEAEWEQGPAV